MSNAEELLDSVYNTSVTAVLSDSSVEEHIIIANDRRITVPAELKRLAVQYDHNVETVTFDCPRYWDEHDMSVMNVYINYLRADGEIGVFKAENVIVDADDSSIMHFEWTVSRNVTEVNGKLAFLACIKNTDADGNEVNHWNSEICKDCYVSEGLEMDDEEFTELYADVIEQWYRDVTGAIQDIESVKDSIIEMRDSGDFDGATFTPSVNDDCDLSWSNDRGRPNPATVNIKGDPGVSPTIQVSGIQGGHRVTITDVNGTKYFDVLDTIVDETEAVSELIDRLIWVGTEEPTSAPVLWFDTSVLDDSGDDEETSNVIFPPTSDWTFSKVLENADSYSIGQCSFDGDVFTGSVTANAQGAGIRSNNKIDLTGVSNLHIEFTATGIVSGNNQFCVYARDDTGTNATDVPLDKVATDDEIAAGSMDIDISSITGSYYIFLGIARWAGSSTVTTTISKIRLDA